MEHLSSRLELQHQACEVVCSHITVICVAAGFVYFLQNFNHFLDGDKYVGPEMVSRILQGGPHLAQLDD